jgi:glycosyltransferase involved in cell wall biosynthesis
MQSKRIAIDGYNLSLESGTGVATYARNLSQTAHDLGHEVHVLYGMRSSPRNPMLREIAFFDTNPRPQHTLIRLTKSARRFASSLCGARARPIPMTGRVIATQFKSRLPYFDQLWNVPTLFSLAHDHFDFLKRPLKVTMPVCPNLMHWTYPLPIKINGAKNIYTFHDLVPLRLPYTTLDVKGRYFRLLKYLSKKADHIVTVSECSRKDIIDILNVPEERVTNTYQAVAIPEKYAGKPEDVVKREVEGTFNLTYRGYMLYFGAIEPKKNVGRLIEGYLSSRIDTPLVLAGKLAWQSKQELRLLNEDVTRYLEQIRNQTFTRHKIMHIGYTPFPLLVSLIKGAKAVLFPSLYEGFGLPVLEAMMLGTPVLTSTEASLPEVAGDAAMLVNPYDSREIAEGILALDRNSNLRGELAHKGPLRAALFSQERYRERLNALYSRLI